jgi:hypothetical protein
MVEIWRLGYALVAVLDGYVVLAACPASPPGRPATSKSG